MKIDRKHLLVLTLLALSLIGLPNADAGSKSKASSHTKEKTQQTTEAKTEEKRKALLQEAIEAVRETENALKALDEKKTDEAVRALERATGKLDIVLARDPELALAPFSVRGKTIDVLADIKAVKDLREQAEEALEDGRVQEARRLLQNLASEVVISTTNIPLATYPKAIKKAAKLIDEGKPELAKHVLQGAFNTFVVTDYIIPLPLVNAQHILQEAEKLSENSNRSKDENQRLADLLKQAREELEFAQALGYGSKKDFKNLYEQLDQIEDKTEGGKSGKGFFDKIKQFLKDAFESSQDKSGDQSKQNH